MCIYIDGAWERLEEGECLGNERIDSSILALNYRSVLQCVGECACVYVYVCDEQCSRPERVGSTWLRSRKPSNRAFVVGHRSAGEHSSATVSLQASLSSGRQAPCKFRWKQLQRM
jgi:hypothetical protein